MKVKLTDDLAKSGHKALVSNLNLFFLNMERIDVAWFHLD